MRSGLTAGGNVLELDSYTYNRQGRLWLATLDTTGSGGGVTSTEHEYNDAGIRIAKTVDGTKTLFLVDSQNPTGYAQVLEELTASGQLIRSYTLGLDVISQFDPVLAADAVLELLYDGHGSTRALVDTAAAIAVVNSATQIFHYSAYGNLLGLTPSQAATTLLYSGEQFDQQLAMQYLRARFYNPATGTFNRLDPFAGNTRDPQSLHKYLYVHGDPVQFADRSGFYPDAISALAKSTMGTFVHTYITRFYEALDFPGIPPRKWGNRWMSTIARDLGSPLLFPVPLRPDMAGIIAPGRGEVYELKPGEITLWSNPVTFFADAAVAIADAKANALTLSSLTYVTWGLGTTFLPGFETWADFWYSPPGYTLVTYANYAVAPGAMLWDFVPSPQAQYLYLLASLSLPAAMIVIEHINALWRVGPAAARGAATVSLANRARGVPDTAPRPELFIAASVGALAVGLGGFSGGF